MVADEDDGGEVIVVVSDADEGALRIVELRDEIILTPAIEYSIHLDVPRRTASIPAVGFAEKIGVGLSQAADHVSTPPQANSAAVRNMRNWVVSRIASIAPCSSDCTYPADAVPEQVAKGPP